MNTESIQEVVPAIRIAQQEASVPYILYRGNPTPVVDLCQHFHEKPAADLLSTRYIILRTQEVFEYPYIALCAEKVTDVLEVSDGCFYRIETHGVDWSYAAYKMIFEGVDYYYIDINALLSSLVSVIGASIYESK